MKCFRELKHDETISSLTEEEAILESFYEKGQIKLSSGGTFNHFMKYSFEEEGIAQVMMLLYNKIRKL